MCSMLFALLLILQMSFNCVFELWSAFECNHSKQTVRFAPWRRLLCSKQTFAMSPIFVRGKSYFVTNCAHDHGIYELWFPTTERIRECERIGVDSCLFFYYLVRHMWPEPWSIAYLFMKNKCSAFIRGVQRSPRIAVAKLAFIYIIWVIIRATQLIKGVK